MTEMDEFGPVDYLVVEFPKGRSTFDGSMAKELTALVDQGPDPGPRSARDPQGR